MLPTGEGEIGGGRNENGHGFVVEDEIVNSCVSKGDNNKRVSLRKRKPAIKYTEEGESDYELPEFEIGDGLKDDSIDAHLSNEIGGSKEVTEDVSWIPERNKRVSPRIRKPNIKYGEDCGKESSRKRVESFQNRKVTTTLKEYYPPTDGMLLQLCTIAREPMKKGCSSLLPSVISCFSDYRNNLLYPLGPKKGSTSATGTSEFEVAKEDSHMMESNFDEEQVMFEPGTIQRVTNGASRYKDSKKAAAEEEYTPTAVILFFVDMDSVPSKSDLHHIFSGYGPLNKSNTEVLKKLRRVRVVFKRRSDAEYAFKSTGRFSIFGPSLVSYRLSYFYPE